MLTTEDRTLLDRVAVLRAGELPQPMIETLRECTARAEGDDVNRVYKALRRHDPGWRPTDGRYRQSAWDAGARRASEGGPDESLLTDAYMRGRDRALGRTARPPAVVSDMIRRPAHIVGHMITTPGGDAA